MWKNGEVHSHSCSPNGPTSSQPNHCPILSLNHATALLVLSFVVLFPRTYRGCVGEVADDDVEGQAQVLVAQVRAVPQRLPIRCSHTHHQTPNVTHHQTPASQTTTKSIQDGI
jgi:hypothetical protein